MNDRFSLNSRILATVIALLAGVALGVAPPLLEGDSDTIAHAVNIILSGGWPWAALALFVGAAQNSRIESMILAAASLLAAVVAYYSIKATDSYVMRLNLGDPSARIISNPFDYGSLAVWGFAAILLGPLLGLAGNLARKNGRRGLLYRLLIPVIAIVETTERIRVKAPLQAPVMGETWSAVRGVAVAAFVALVVHTTIGSWRSRQSTVD
ncbi:DUF6518 family protein [Streptomyces sp. NPDC046984]|uniref:DUF6518 family protein n=1 Tax=Streptomyces sp. NPDC046984 TaxID=3155138 RepID=UPI0033FB17DD